MAFFLVGGERQLSLTIAVNYLPLGAKLKTDSNCRISFGCIPRQRQDVVVSNA